MLARTHEGARALTEQFRDREVGKRYAALVLAEKLPALADAGEITDPLDGREATTSWRVPGEESCVSEFPFA